ncbi:MAG: hypothetical protein JSR44_01580 [Spirochaetes bacterium]|nr:hypothetical protein [Spirochaetota bacterium]
MAARTFIILMLMPALFGCIGVGTPPDQFKMTQAQNEVLGMFVREIGESEMKLLIHDPNDPTNPGMPMGDLLYILNYVPPSTLIQLVKGVGAQTVLDLILSIKRVACTRYEAIFPGNGFDARSVPSMNSCTYQHFHIPNLMVQLLSGTNANGLQNLIDTLKHSYSNLPCTSSGGSLAVNQALCPLGTTITTQPATNAAGDTFNSQAYKTTVDHYSYLMKLAFIVAGFDTPTAADPNLSSPTLVGPAKLYNLMNLTLDARDMVYLLDSFDSNTVNLTRNVPATLCPAPGLPAQLPPNPAVAPWSTSSCSYIDTSAVTMTLNAYTNRPDYTGTPVYNTYETNGNLWKDICPTLLPSNACDLTVAGYQLQGLRNLLSIMDQVTNTSKMGTLLNGKRTVRATPAQTAAAIALADDAQIRYYTDRLRVTLEHRTTCTAASYPVTPAATMSAWGVPVGSQVAFNTSEKNLQDFANPQAGIGGWNTNLATLINDITNINNMMDLVYTIDDGYDINHVSVTACPNRGLDNLLVMVNNINGAAPHVNDLTGYNPPYTNLTANTTNSELQTAAYLIDNVALDSLNPNPAKRNKVKYLAQYIGDTLAVLKLACYTGVADNNPTNLNNACLNRGLINQVADGSKLDDLSNIDLTAAGQKLKAMTDGINDIESMRFLVQNVSMSNLNGMIKGMLVSGTVKTANLVNQITGNNCWATSDGVTSVTVSAPGALYTSPPTVNFTAPVGGPTNVTTVAKAVIETDQINFPATYQQLNSVVVLNPGSGYSGGGPGYVPSAPAISFAGGGGGGASASVSVGGIGSCAYQLPAATAFRGFPSNVGTGATGLGKMVNVINYVTGSPKTLVDLINGVTNGSQLGVLINGIGRSSNLVGIMNATIDPARANNASINDLINLMNNISLGDTYKLVHMIDAFGNAIEDVAITYPSGDHDMVAQLIASYQHAGNIVNSNSGVGYQAMATLVSSLSMTGGGGYTTGSAVTAAGGLSATLNVATVGAISGVTVTDPGAGCTTTPTITVSGGGGAGAILTPALTFVATTSSLTLLSIASPGVVNWASHSLTANTPVVFSTAGSLPTGLTAGTTYYVSATGLLPDSFSVSAAPGGAAINFTGAQAGLQAISVANGAVRQVNIVASGSGFIAAPTLTFVGGGCTTPPQATAYINGIGTVTVINGGSGYTNNNLSMAIAGGGSGAVLTPTVSGALNTGGSGLSSISGGTRYVTGNVCPIVGAGGTGGTCTVTAAGGALTGCSAMTAGSGYGVGRIVKIGGGATAYALVAGNAAGGSGTIAIGLGSIATNLTGGIKVIDAVAGTGCGYGAAPLVKVVGCGIAPTVTAIINGSGVVTDFNVTGAGSSCGTGVKVIVGETPAGAYAYHSDGASAIVQQVTGGVVTSISVSNASINAAQLVQNLDRDATGQGTALIYRPDDSAWAPYTSACSSGPSPTWFPTVWPAGAWPGNPFPALPPAATTCFATDTLRPNISTREAMVRLLNHGFTPTMNVAMSVSPKSYFNGSLGVGGPSNGVAGYYSNDWPGIGPQHIAGAILNNVTSGATQTLINLMNSDTTSLEDAMILLGCADHSTYTNGWSTYTWQQLCTESGGGGSW